MRPPNENPLLREILTDEKFAEVRRASLDGSLALIRRRRRVAQALQLSVLVLVSALAITTVLLRQPKQSIVASNQTNPIVAPSKDQPESEPSVKTISDEELFALFPGRAVALIGTPGHQEFVVLNAPVRN